MCGRYQFTATQNPELERILAALPGLGGAQGWTPGDVYPSSFAPVLVAREGRILPRLCSWGFPGGPRGLVINARAETAAQKPMFSAALQTGRCVVPTTGFYEWDSARHKYLFRLPGTEAVYLAGLRARFDSADCFVILTTGPNPSMDGIHDRMPLVLRREQVRPWLTDPAMAVRLLAGRPPLLEPAPQDGQLRMW